MDAAKILKKRGLRITKIRVAILETLGANNLALPYSKLQKELSRFDRTTLYRTLLILKDKGFIHKALEEKGESYYALCSDCTSSIHNHNHVHFKCNKCSSVQCLHITKELQLSIPKMSVNSIEITAKGTCSACLLAD
ncbi:MAG: transcriptional repressor [Bacteroidota bacterium]|nr:transcriptional repressor [Bacteroidota bacterium]